MYKKKPRYYLDINEVLKDGYTMTSFAEYIGSTVAYVSKISKRKTYVLEKNQRFEKMKPYLKLVIEEDPRWFN